MIFGIELNRKNPEFTIDDLKFWSPGIAPFLNTEAGQAAFERLYPIVNKRIFESIWGVDWPLAMSLCFSHYLTIIGNQAQKGNVGNDLASLPSLDTYAGMLASMTVGSFSKSFDLAKTMIDTDDAKWWNLTSYGAMLMALYKTKAAPSIFVVTPTPGPSFERDLAAFYRRKNGDINVIIAEMNEHLHQYDADISDLQNTRAISAKPGERQ